ncbi:GNAT family N-acetyltransferase [Haloechinothrix sp. LS1_15]|uniref:GNAT family N-acetyltransferase n=1 Tax=Haloechinothrix sp. LS1_15 TaxID=2652248 RepID=UPI0029463B75|nr:GNAT family N-acetyltransferase [Haloechinothrix sp. LS1_15]MDV6013521.1 GNAT family N-acetyltransferase [Haloechinothrix sp. LS1_15]
MGDIVVRPAQGAEIDRSGEIAVLAYQAAGLLSESSDYVARLRDATNRAEQAELLVAVDGDDVVLGTVTVAAFGTPLAQIARPGELEFRMLATDPAYRGRGIGELLTYAVMDRAAQLGCLRVVMCVDEQNTAAQRLYRRLGFVRLPDRDWSPAPEVHLHAFERAVDGRYSPGGGR